MTTKIVQVDKKTVTAKRKTRDENCKQMNDKMIIVAFVIAILLAIICFPLPVNTHTHFHGGCVLPRRYEVLNHALGPF